MWILKDASGKNVAGKYQYGDSGHARKRAEKDYGGRLFWENELTEFIGKDKNGKIWYRIKYRESNPMKKKRKGNPQRITQAWLEKRVGLINQMLKRPETAYTQTKDGLKSNAGHFYIDSAYGGVGLEMMAKGGGAHAINGGHVPKRELSNFMDGFIAAIREIQSSRVSNPSKRKAKAKKKTTRKKNPKDTDRVFYASNAVYSVEFNGNGWYVFRNDNYGTHVEHFAGPGDKGKKDAISYLKALKKHTAAAPKKNPVGAVKSKGFIIASFAPIYNEVVYALDSKGARMDFRKTNAKVWKTENGAGAAAVNIANGWGEPVIVAPVNTSVKQIESYFPGVRKRGKAARRRNPVGPTQRELDSAANLFKDFTGDHPEDMKSVKLPVPKTGLAIGELDGVLYTTIRDGKTEHYQHDFKKGSRPLLASSHDGKSLHILGGEYEFTERGIEDK